MAIADIQRAIPATIPHQVTKANMSMADMSAAKRTNSRSPPRSKCGRLADWWIRISRGFSITPSQHRRAADAEQRRHEPSAKHQEGDSQRGYTRPSRKLAQFAAENQ